MHEVWKRQQVHEDARKMFRTKTFCLKILESGERRSRLDKQGEILIWCRKCSGYARQRMGPKLMNCCKAGASGTKEHNKMLKTNSVLEDGRVLAKESGN